MLISFYIQMDLLKLCHLKLSAQCHPVLTALTALLLVWQCCIAAGGEQGKGIPTYSETAQFFS